MRLKFKKTFLTVIAASCFASIPVNAAVNTEMQNWFDSMGGFTNATPPSEYKGQTMNGYSGGGLYQRNPVKNYQLATAAAPSLNIGCGGIDLTAGSFSFINKAALTSLFRNIGTSVGYSFLLAIKSSMPEMASLFEYLQDVANKVNRGQISSCELSQGIPFVDGSPLSENLSKVFSHVAGATSNKFTDAFESLDQTKTSAANRNDAQAMAIAQDPSKKKQYQPGNVVWEALGNATGLDNEDKLFIMSMTGTIIISPTSGTTTGISDKSTDWRYVEPTGSEINDFIGYKDGAPTSTIYLLNCDTPTDCLNPIPSAITVTPFLSQISAKIDNLKGNVLGRTAQNVADFKLVDAAGIPVWKMISVSANYNPGFVDAYKRLIAVDVAYGFVNNKLKTATQVLANAQNGASAPQDARDALKKLSARLDVLTSTLHAARIVEYNKVAQEAQLERQLQFMHQAMLQGIPAQAFNSMLVFGGVR